MWNFNDMHGWNNLRQVTQDDKELINCWNASASFEECYQKWSNRLNPPMANGGGGGGGRGCHPPTGFSYFSLKWAFCKLNFCL